MGGFLIRRYRLPVSQTPPLCIIGVKQMVNLVVLFRSDGSPIWRDRSSCKWILHTAIADWPTETPQTHGTLYKIALCERNAVPRNCSCPTIIGWLQGQSSLDFPSQSVRHVNCTWCPRHSSSVFSAIILLRTIAIYHKSKRITVFLSIVYAVCPGIKLEGLYGSPCV